VLLAACCVGPEADLCVTGFGRGKVLSFLYDLCSVVAFRRVLGVGLMLYSYISDSPWRPSRLPECWDIKTTERAIMMVQ
jgi:hypothetical protein